PIVMVIPSKTTAAARIRTSSPPASRPATSKTPPVDSRGNSGWHCKVRRRRANESHDRSSIRNAAGCNSRELPVTRDWQATENSGRCLTGRTVARAPLLGRVDFNPPTRPLSNHRGIMSTDNIKDRGLIVRWNQTYGFIRPDGGNQSGDV